MACMKTSTVLVTGAVLLVGLLGCAEVASADDNIGTPTNASSSWLAPQAQYVPVLPAPTTSGASTDTLTVLTVVAPAPKAGKATAPKTSTKAAAPTTTVQPAPHSASTPADVYQP